MPSSGVDSRRRHREPELRRALAELDPGLVAYPPATLGDAIGRGAAVDPRSAVQEQ